MKKRLLLKTINDEVIDGQRVITIALTTDEIKDFCLCLCLLGESLITELFVSAPTSSIHFKRRVDSGKNRLIQRKEGLTLELCQTELERLIDFFLRYYRDGAAEVDHVDIEAYDQVGNELDAYVTIEVADYLPPLSSEEARHRLAGQ